MADVSARTWDCLVIGGGPAGLTAALYLARFQRSALVFDAGQSRAGAIPRSHNHPGFTEGIAGKDLLRILRTQAEDYGAHVVSGTVLSLGKNGRFTAQTTAGPVAAERVILATGITDNAPTFEKSEPAVLKEAVRYCPICDGFEAIDKKVGVYGPPGQADSKARFLRQYSPNVTLIPSAPGKCAEQPDPPYEIAAAPAKTFSTTAKGVAVTLANGQRLAFDVLYPALGCDVHSDLATALGARTNPSGCLVVDDKQQTTVEGLYAAGDVVSDLHQLVVAEAHAAIAATAVHNSLPHILR